MGGGQQQRGEYVPDTWINQSLTILSRDIRVVCWVSMQPDAYTPSIAGSGPTHT